MLVSRSGVFFWVKFADDTNVFMRLVFACAGETRAAFEKHVATYGGLDICVNSAGIGNPIPFRRDETDGTLSWRRTVDVNLLAVIDCTRLAVCFKFQSSLAFLQ